MFVFVSTQRGATRLTWISSDLPSGLVIHGGTPYLPPWLRVLGCESPREQGRQQVRVGEEAVVSVLGDEFEIPAVHAGRAQPGRERPHVRGGEQPVG